MGDLWSSAILVMLLLLLVQSNAIVNLGQQKQLINSLDLEEVNPNAAESLRESQNEPMVFFEVKKPIDLPHERPCAIVSVLQHDFGYTYGQPPVVAAYEPPSQCGSPWKKIIMEWKATCKGRQYDRIAGVWLGGAEILRTCTAEPTKSGIEWTILKDVTKYHSLLQKPQKLEVQLNNLVDKTYTGVYHVNISFKFYEAKKILDSEFSSSANVFGKLGFPADLIQPISLPVTQQGGAWFQIQNSSDTVQVPFRVPSNAYRAVLEVFVSFHQHDEFWYTNPPNEFLEANKLTGLAGNGPFREVLVAIDGDPVGAVWPFPVIYTGGINPLFWRPVSGIGSFDLPSYDIELTPFLGRLLDGKDHVFSFNVTNGLDIWFVDANLHIWIDDEESIKGDLTSYESSSLSFSTDYNFKGLNGSFKTTAFRKISSSGWVESSHGKLITHASTELNFSNNMEFKDNADTQTVRQKIVSYSKVIVETSKGVVSSTKVNTIFPLYVYSYEVDEGNGTYLQIANVSNAIDKDVSVIARKHSSFSSLNNTQNAQGYILVKNNLVSSGLGSTQQFYDYHSTQGCYSRTVSVSNYTFISDSTDTSCGFTG